MLFCLSIVFLGLSVILLIGKLWWYSKSQKGKVVLWFIK